MSSGVQNTLMFPGNGNAGNNNAQKPVNQYPPNQYYLFSPTFQCYTSTPFYRNLLIELEHVASYIDQGKSRSREIVWRQLFTLLGAKPVVCSKPFEPVLKSWTESPTINLLAIELLYLAFATAFDRFPDLIKTRFPSGTQIPFPNNNEVHLPMKTVNQRPMLAAPTPIAPNRPIQASPQSKPNPTPIQPIAAVPIQPREIVPAPPVPIQPQTNVAPPAQPSNTATNASSVDAKPSPEVFMKLIDLQSWKTALDNLPASTTEKIWTIWKTYDNPPIITESSFEKIINSWAKNIVPNVQAITRMHDVISFLKTSNSINLDGPAPSSQPPQPTPPPPPPQSYQNNNPPNQSALPSFQTAPKAIQPNFTSQMQMPLSAPIRAAVPLRPAFYPQHFRNHTPLPFSPASGIDPTRGGYPVLPSPAGLTQRYDHEPPTLQNIAAKRKLPALEESDKKRMKTENTISIE